MRALALVVVAHSALADPSPAPHLIGHLDVDQLAKDSKRNILAGNLVAGAGAVIGAVSTGLFIAGLVRQCATPGCNDNLSTAGNWVGAGALVFVTVGITLFSVGMTQKKILKQLR
jgi:hypothetical protein